MILTALRLGEQKAQMANGKSQIICSPVDYALAELIGNKLLLHMAAAYRMINGAEQPSVPKIQPLDQRAMLLSLLPDEFESKTLIAEASSQGISARTATRWNEDWQQNGLVQKFKYGWYKKVV